MYSVNLPENFTIDYRSNPKATIPSNINLSTIAFLSEFSSASLAFFMSHPRATVSASDNGNSVTIFSIRNLEIDSGGWTSIDTILVRSANIYAPSGRFPVYVNMSALYSIGYDAAVCVQRYDPWIVEVSNTSTASPSVLRVVGRGDGGVPLSPSGTIRGAPLANLRYLNTTGKYIPFLIGHANTIAQMVSDNGRNPHHYFASPAVGPPCTPRTTSLLTLAGSVGCVFHRWHRPFGIHRTFSRPARRGPCTGWCGEVPTIPRGVGTRRRTIIRKSDTGIYHLHTVATDKRPVTCLGSGNNRRIVRADVATQYPAERIWAL